MALTWSKHGPDMVLKIRHYIDNCLRPCWLSPENFRALASLEHTFPAGAVVLWCIWILLSLSSQLWLSSELKPARFLCGFSNFVCLKEP